MLLLLVLCWLPACHSSCCLLSPPPAFKLQAPPKPPGMSLEFDFTCREAIKLWSPKLSPGQKGLHHDGAGSHDDYLPGVHIVNHTSMYHIPLSPDDNITPASPSLSESKPISVGMILGILIGVLLLVLIVLLTYIFTKRKMVKLPIKPDPDHDGQHNFLHNYKIRGWPWKTNSDPGKKLRNLFNGLHKSEGCDSSTSSESGYCEDAYEEKGGKPVVISRKRTPKPRPTSSRMGAMLDTTPDIIASTQTTEIDDEDDVPKRWSMFGLLPSLKPLLVPTPGQLQISEDDKITCPDDEKANSDQTPLRNSGVRLKPPEVAHVPIMKPVIPAFAGDNQLGNIHLGILEPTRPPRPRTQSQHARHTGSLPRNSSRQKKSRVRIRNEGRDREIEV